MNYLELYKNKLVEIYYNKELDTFDVGYIINEDENNIFVENYNPLGLRDGHSLILKDNINIIKENTEYIKNIEKLISINSKENILNSYIFDNKNISLKTNNIFLELLEKAKNEKLICSIILFEDSKVFGYIEKIDTEIVFVKYKEEITTIRIEDIKNIYVNALVSREDVFLDK